jgi:glycosyltransferase involved in cell wall biosynthesis
MRVLMWHVHGSYQTNFVAGRHEVILPVEPGRGPDGRGRAETWDWPARAREVTRAQAQDLDVDVIVLQRPEELDHLAGAWLGGRRPGRDVPAVYLEHNCPQGRINEMRHPAADRPDLTVVHVTHANALLWDCGTTPTCVIPHGVIDPGRRYTGALPRAGVIVNEPERRGRVVGADLYGVLARSAPLDLFGMGTAEPAARLAGEGLDVTAQDLPQARMHDELARRRAYLHPYRWTSLGLGLIEAMLLGLPVVCLATTEAATAVPADCGAVSNDIDVLSAELRRLVHDPDLARARGERARQVALEQFSLTRFLDDWDSVLKEVCAR